MSAGWCDPWAGLDVAARLLVLALAGGPLLMLAGWAAYHDAGGASVLERHFGGPRVTNPQHSQQHR